jgi:YidC/Oxa1 family membrane protein insertase
VRLFAGAKENNVLEAYEKQGVTHLSLSIDWGWFRWFEKPIFWLLDRCSRREELRRGDHPAHPAGARHVPGGPAPVRLDGGDARAPAQDEGDPGTLQGRQGAQQEIMKLYKEERVNPLAGCLPIFLQIPVFFALYKVLVLTIEMRHQPFVLWIKDLSAPDPLHVLNLFGLLPSRPPASWASACWRSSWASRCGRSSSCNPPRWTRRSSRSWA